MINECVTPSQLHKFHKPVSSSKLDSLYACIASESFIVHMASPSKLSASLRMRGWAYLFFGVEKTPFSLYSARILPTIHSEIPVETLQIQRFRSKYHLPVALATFAVQFTTRPDFWASRSK